MTDAAMSYEDEENTNDLNRFQKWFSEQEEVSTLTVNDNKLLKNYVIVSLLTYVALVALSQLPLMMAAVAFASLLFTMNMFYETQKSMTGRKRTILFSLGTLNLLVLTFSTFWAASLLLAQNLNAF